MVRGRAPVPTLLPSTIDAPYSAATVTGAADSARAHGVMATIAVTARDGEAELAAVRTLRGRHPSAIPLFGSRSAADPCAAALRGG